MIRPQPLLSRLRRSLCQEQAGLIVATLENVSSHASRNINRPRRGVGVLHSSEQVRRMRNEAANAAHGPCSAGLRRDLSLEQSHGGCDEQWPLAVRYRSRHAVQQNTMRRDATHYLAVFLQVHE